jgi:hypothetical protein
MMEVGLGGGSDACEMVNRLTKDEFSLSSVSVSVSLSLSHSLSCLHSLPTRVATIPVCI